MTKYLTDSTDIEIEEVSGTQNIRCNFASGNSLETSLTLLSNKFNNLTTYSLNEIDTGETWIDGKPIYRKVISFGALPNTDVKDVAHNINDLDYIINLYGIGERSLDKYYFPLNMARDSLSIQIGLYANDTYVSVYAGSDRSNTSAYIVIEYTKTTD